MKKLLLKVAISLLLIGGLWMNSAVASQFAGLWTGTLYANIPGSASTVELEVSLDSNNSGTITKTDSPVATHIIPSGLGLVSGNTMTIDLPVAIEDQEDPDCINWNVLATLTCDPYGYEMTVSITGTACGDDGGTWMDFSGTLYKAWTVPATPVLVAPGNRATQVSLTPTLTTNPFADSDPDSTHMKTEWEISTEQNFLTPVLYKQSTDRLTSLTVPDMILEGMTTYYWRVRFYNSNYSISEWSDVFSFTTAQGFADLNLNGIPDNLENNFVDLDNDGTPDIQQTGTIKSLNTAVGNGQMGVSIRESDTVSAIDSINAVDPDDISSFVRPHNMPLGLMSFRLNVNNAGDTALVRAHFSQAAPENATWLFHDSINGWTDHASYVTFSADRKSALIELRDGIQGDADGLANGIITDPGGFGIASWLTGTVSDEATGQGISNGTITVSDFDVTLSSQSSGEYLTMMLPGVYDLVAAAPGYESKTLSGIEIQETRVAVQNIALAGRVKITGLQVSGTPSPATPVTFTVNAHSGSDILNYRYSLHHGYGTPAYTGNDWQLMTVTEYQAQNACTHTFYTGGKSIVVAWATSSATDSVNPSDVPIIGWSIDADPASCTPLFTGVQIIGDQKVNETITLSVSAVSPCSRPLYYRFCICYFDGFLINTLHIKQTISI